MSEIRDRVYANPDKPAYIMAKTSEVVTRIELEERSNQCAHLFRDLGLSIGDHIAILMENNRYFFEICSAASRAGIIYTPVSTYLKESEVEYIVNNCEAKLFVSSMAKSDIARILIDKMSNVKTRLMVGGVIDGYISYEEKMNTFPTTPIADEMAGQDMLYSSGTTGRPKGVKINYEPMPYGEI
ncbi:MAG: AMP-binding protein, partial [Deltaproteobacteria bacterium]|nr:AMP-binding protein [Deltaproteobacteria bacterium]